MEGRNDNSDLREDTWGVLASLLAVLSLGFPLYYTDAFHAFSCRRRSNGTFKFHLFNSVCTQGSGALYKPNCSTVALDAIVVHRKQSH